MCTCSFESTLSFTVATLIDWYDPQSFLDAVDESVFKNYYQIKRSRSICLVDFSMYSCGLYSHSVLRVKSCHKGDRFFCFVLGLLNFLA